MVTTRHFCFLALLTVITSALINAGMHDTPRHATSGRAFTLAFFPEFLNVPAETLRNILYFASTTDGTCTVSYHDHARRRTSINLVANQIIEKALPDTTQMTNIGTGVEPKAIYVNCSSDITLYGFNKYQQNFQTSDSFTVLPDDSLSTRYLVASVDNGAFIGIAATKANTQVTIDLRSKCSHTFNGNTYRSGDILNVTLSIENVFRLGGRSFSDRCDLAATEIQSSYPVAVFSGALYYYLDNKASGLHMVHEVPPVTAFATTFIIPWARNTAYMKMAVRVVASEKNTSVSVTSELDSGATARQVYHLNDKEVVDLDFSPDSNVILNSSSPVMVTQEIMARIGGGSTLIPAITQYEGSFLIRSFTLDTSTDLPQVTVVTKSMSTESLRLNGLYPQNILWKNLTNEPYAVGSFSIQRNVTYHISNTSPMLVRVNEIYSQQYYGYIAGYKLPHIETGVHVNLTCLADSWIVTLDNLHFKESEVAHIYLGNYNCIGSLEKNLLIFNKSYDDCNTKINVSNGTLSYTNTLINAHPSAGIVVRDIIWLHDIKCSMPVDGTDTVHVYPDYNATQHTGTSGLIHESAVHISLYKDASYQHPVEGSVISAKIGQPMYVQVASSGSQNTVMVVRSCDAHLEDEKHVSYPLIDNGCTESGTEILITRNQVMRFKFVMLDLLKDEDGIYVTCHVTFCDPMDFSARCQQRCHTDPHFGIVG